MRKQKFWRQIDIVFLILLPIVAVVLSLVTRANLFLSSLFFYGLPAIYLSFRNLHAVKRTLIFTLLFALPLGIVIDHWAHVHHIWYVPTVLPRILGWATWEAIFWGLNWTYAITIFYEHFLDKGRHNILDRKMKNLMAGIVIFAAAYFLLWLNGQVLAKIPFPSAIAGGLFFAVPLVLFLGLFPRFLSKYVKVALYFSVLAFLNELISLRLGNWFWPGGQFVGWLQFGDLRFPFEEFFFYVLLGSVAILSYFEYFDDSHLKREARRYT